MLREEAVNLDCAAPQVETKGRKYWKKIQGPRSRFMINLIQWPLVTLASPSLMVSSPAPPPGKRTYIGRY